MANTQPELLARLAAQGAMIERLTSDSRACAPGVAFFAYPGEKADGRAHIAEAAARGAAAVLWEEEAFAWRPEWRVPNVAVRGLKQRAGALAHEFYGRPSDSLWVCGVTGTNGKTSCSQWIAAALGRGGTRSGVVGTLGSGFPGALSALANTTPDALEAHALLKAMLQQGAAAVAMEVSSHGLVQGRVNGIAFDCALFTNLSHDHLDYHGSMDAYAEAKARLFDSPGLQTAVLNLDDVAGVGLAPRLAARGGIRTIGYSLAPLTAPPTREYLAAVAIDGASVQVDSSWGRASATLNQLGRFNVANALGVLGCLLACGLPFGEAVALLADPAHQAFRVGELAAAQADDGALRPGVDAGDIGPAAHQLDRHDVEQMAHLVGQRPEAVAQFGLEAFQRRLLLEIGQAAVEAQADLEIGHEGFGQQHRGAPQPCGEPAE